MNNKEVRITALLVLDTIFFLLEAIVGYSVLSLALIADSFHMLNDIISLIIALWAVRMKNSRQADGKYTYGWQRAEILGALINAVFLVALCFTIIMEAIQRFFQPQVITNPKLILVVGCAGLLSNGIGLVLFHEHGHSHSHGGGGGGGHDTELGHSHSHADGVHDHEANRYDLSHEESTVGETTPLMRGNNTLKSTPSEVFDYFPDNLVERYDSASSGRGNGNDTKDKHGKTDLGSGSGSGSAPSDAGAGASVSMPVSPSLPAGKKKSKSMNMEGVFLHVLGDALGNIGVIITAVVIWKTNWWWRYYCDPLTSLAISALIVYSATGLFRKSSKILLQATPPYIDSDQIVSSLLKLPLVKNVHDFHVWNLNEDILIASLHVELSEDCHGTPLSSSDGSGATATANATATATSQQKKNDNTMIDGKVFLEVVEQVRKVLHHYQIDAVTVQPSINCCPPPISNGTSASASIAAPAQLSQ